ncbi:MAG: hypothetical protein KDA75_15920 [Planctomycetaceae bacterium]|nr:hypothetical protein [Planctomycetaceae bacterium]
MAAAVSKILEVQGQSDIVIGPFTGPSEIETSGPGIQKILQEELEKQGLRIGRRAKIRINGKFRSKVEDSGLILRIEAELVDSFNAVLVNLNSETLPDFPVKAGKIEVEVADESTAIAVLQPTADIPSDLPRSDRASLIRSSLEGNEAPPHIAGTTVFASRSSPYGVQVTVNGKPRIPTVDADGLAFIEIKRGEEYEVILINNSRHRAVGKLQIDGLGSFAFSEVRVESGPDKGDPLYNFWAIRPNDRARITGWHKRDEGKDNFRAFEVTSYADSAAGLLGHTSDIGTITAIFSAAWEKGTDPPADLKEPPKTTSKGLPDATKEGRAKTQDVQPVELEVGVVRAAVSIRYSKAK